LNQQKSIGRRFFMHRFSRGLACWLLGVVACLAVPALAQVSVRSVRVMGSKDTVEVEVEASDRIVPETQVLAGPDRLVVDFPNAIPSNRVRSQSVDRGEVKDVRVGLFQARPPVTRVVLDLKAARSYQVFPYGRTVMIKVVGEGATSDGSSDHSQPGDGSALVAANYTRAAQPIQISAPAQPPLEVSYRNGLLGIRANRATLSEVLYAVEQRTGADIAIPAGSEQERVVTDIEPAPAPEVLARLLNGSSFNFLILSAPDDPGKLDRVILSLRGEAGSAPLPPVEAQSNPPVDVPADVQNLVNIGVQPPVAQNQPDNSVQPPPVVPSPANNTVQSPQQPAPTGPPVD
jgi:hypothetical protein